MSFSDQKFYSAWIADLSTRKGAETAADLAGYFCYTIALILGSYAFRSVRRESISEESAPLIILGVLLFCSLFALTGVTLQKGKGAILGTICVVILVLSCLIIPIFYFQSFDIRLIFAFILFSTGLIIIVQGVNAAWKLRSGDLYDEEAEFLEDEDNWE